MLAECKLFHWHVMFPPRHWQQHLRRTVLSSPSTLGKIPSVARVPRPVCFQSANTCALACDVSHQALAAALEKNSTITTINLLRNSIRDEGAKARCFQSANTCALACDVSHQALATAVEKNSTITTIYLLGNSIGVEGAKARLLAECKHLCIGM